jgi:uncharacterized protein (DUF697 family)
MAVKKSQEADSGVDSDLTRELSAENKIKNYVIASVGASIVPVPLFDIAAVVAIQLRMIQKLSQLYGQPFSERAARNIITALAGGVLGYGAGFVVAASAVKVIPGIGWMVGMASLPLVAGAATYAVGRSLVKHFEEGGSMFDFSADRMRAYYQEQFEKGKELAAKAKANLKGGAQSAEDISSAA